MVKPEYNYDSDYFYQRIQESAGRQMQENHITWDKVIVADLKFETSMMFSEMKDGEYRAQPKKENERGGKRVDDLLSRAHAGVEPKVWRMVLETGLGKIQTQGIAFDKIGNKIQDGQRVTVHKLPLNFNALQVWLRHHLQMYRSIENRKLEGEENSDTPADVNHGIGTDKRIEKEVNDD